MVVATATPVSMAVTATVIRGQIHTTTTVIATATQHWNPPWLSSPGKLDSQVMPRITAFRALRFDPSRLPETAKVIAPPYDVISAEQRAQLEAQHARNIVHLDLPRGEGNVKYTNARAMLDAWIADGSLREDAEPAIYRYEQTFSYDTGTGSRSYTRKGFFALVQLSPFSERVVLPHEHTLSGPKVDRFNLIETTQAHFSEIFALYRDPQGEAEAALESATAGPATVDATTPDGCRHRLWVVTDKAIISAVVCALLPKQVMIADGHHRYETMVAIREALRPAGAAPGSSQADFGPMFFARAEDPGLLVLPTHRMVHGLTEAALDGLAERCQPWFQVETGNEQDSASIGERLRREGEASVTFAIRRPKQERTTWLRLRKDADLSRLGPPTLGCLDVSVLHGLILDPILGIGAEAMAKQQNLTYSHDLRDTLDRVSSGAVQAAFIMNATKVDQVLDACEAGFVLPQKSTYFQPKLATGLVMQKIRPDQPPAI